MASVQAGGARSRMPIVGINVTPMVDVVLVLLVIMMVSALYIASQSIQIDLPKAANSDDNVTSLAAVTLSKDHKIYFNGELVTEAQLKRHLEQEHDKNNELNLIVSADASVTHGSVVHVIDIAKELGISKFAINVERAQ